MNPTGDEVIGINPKRLLDGQSAAGVRRCGMVVARTPPDRWRGDVAAPARPQSA
jgi:hypothetical protein